MITKILKFEKNVAKEALAAHHACVTALHAHKHGFISAGLDGMLKLWSHELKPYKDITFDISPFVGNLAFGKEIRSARWVGNKIIAGTESSEVYEIDLPSKNILSFSFAKVLFDFL